MTKPIPLELELQPVESLTSALPDPARAGSLCPRCQNGRLDYNGLLELECPACGFMTGFGAGCS